MYKLMLGCALLMAGSAIASAEQMQAPVNADELKWAPAPKNLPPGAQWVVVSGDPSQEGLFVIRLKMPAGYKVPAHNHPTLEYVTVLSGEFHLGMGDKLDMAKSATLTAGGFAMAPAKMNHYGWAASDTVIQLHGPGPFGITYVDPAEDPSKK